MLDSLRRLFGGAPKAPSSAAARTPAPPSDTEADEQSVTVSEIDAAGLRALLAGGKPLLLLDIREQWEWAQAHLPAQPGPGAETRHLAMNSVPHHLGELPRDRPIVVICAHGSRSYSVAHWLGEQGFTAHSLSGGIARWARSGGPTESSRR